MNMKLKATHCCKQNENIHATIKYFVYENLTPILKQLETINKQNMHEKYLLKSIKHTQKFTENRIKIIKYYMALGVLIYTKYECK